MSVVDILVGLFEHLVAAGDGWHDFETAIRLFLLFSATTMLGGRVVERGLDTIGADRLQQHLRNWRRWFMLTVGRIRPRHVLTRVLPIRTRILTQGRSEAWTWRAIGLWCCVLIPVLLIDVGILWVGLPWLARQASLPVWVGLAAATVLWATGPVYWPMSGRLAAGGIVALVWLSGSPYLAVGGLVFLLVFALIGAVWLKAMHDLVTGLKRWRRSEWA